MGILVYLLLSFIIIISSMLVTAYKSEHFLSKIFVWQVVVISLLFIEPLMTTTVLTLIHIHACDQQTCMKLKY